MSDNSVNVGASDETHGNRKNRRKFLVGVTGAVGAGVGVLTAAPFIGSLRPSRKAQAAGAPVPANVEGMAAGELRRVFWRKKPVWLLARNKEMLDYAEGNRAELADADSEKSRQPAYCKNETRSIRPDVLVAIGLCTHLGCSPTQDQDAKQGFLCTCHGSKFDVAGRVVQGSPAPENLIIPPHRYADDATIIIGEDEGAAA